MSAQLAIMVIPKSSRNEVSGRRGDDFLVRVTTVPEGGKANAAVIKLLAKRLGVPKTSIAVLRGETSRHKLLEFATLEQPELDQLTSSWS